MMTERPPDASDHPRRVRSYVLRPGRITVAQRRALEALWPQFGIDPPAQCIDLDQLFGHRAPRMIEIGFGAGEALLDFASQHPDVDCIGIEVHSPGVGHLLLGAQAARLENLRVARQDAMEVLDRWLPPASIMAVHVFFPDPWPKKRHHKRRLVQPEFVDLVARVLVPLGILRLATDWEPYAQHMRAVLDVHPAFENVAGAAGFVPRPGDRPLTRFERRGHRLGHDVWDLAYARKVSGG
jgi:tRNA (guanine-N7-)-methyltransferase